MNEVDHIRIWSALAVIIGAGMLIALERLFPYNEQRLLRGGLGTDLAMYAIAQSFIVGLVISFIISVIDEQTGLSRWHILRSQPLPAQFAAVFVFHDFYIYWFHRWQHQNPILWRIHEAHHSAKEVDWLSGSRSHSLEILINQTVEFGPIVLFCSPEIAVIKGCVDALWGMYIHSNINVRSGWMQFIINGPEMHRWHHAAEEEARNKNYSTKLAIWDWVFGTAFRPKNRKPISYGLDIEFPKNYFKQHIYAFRRNSRSRQ